MDLVLTMYLLIVIARPRFGTGSCTKRASELGVTMRIEVWDRGFKADKCLRNYAGLRLMSVFDHFARQVEGVTVCLTEVGLPDGGIEKRCRMVARLIRAGEVRAEDGHAGLYAAIDRAAERLATSVEVELERRELMAAAPPVRVRDDASKDAAPPLLTRTG
jgi:ribosome-associated translation inhibitor RaiA